MHKGNQDIVQSLDSLARVLGRPVRTFQKYLDNGTASRQTTTNQVAVNGIAISYTAPDYPVVLLVISSVLVTASGATPIRYGVTQGGTLFGNYTYDIVSNWTNATSWGILPVAAGATVSLGAQLDGSGVLTTIANSNADPTSKYSSYGYIEFRTGNV